MKSYFLGLSLLLTSLVLIAQPPGRPGGKGNFSGGTRGKGGFVQKELNLTAEQQKKARGLQDKFRAEMKALNENEAITVKEQRDRREKLMQAHRDQMKALLTPDQQKKMDDLRAQQRNRNELMAKQQLERMTLNLNLSNEQTAKLQAAQQKNRDQMRAIMDNQKMSRTDRKAAIDKLQKDMKATLKNTLTSEQYDKMQSMRRNYQGPRGGGKRGYGPGDDMAPRGMQQGRGFQG